MSDTIDTMSDTIDTLTYTCTYFGAIPNQMYWYASQKPNEWLANCAVTTNTWEIEVNFNE